MRRGLYRMPPGSVVAFVSLDIWKRCITIYRVTAVSERNDMTRSTEHHGRPQSAPGESGPARFKSGPHGPQGPHGHGRGPWSRARRVNVRVAMLSVRAEEPMHGYQIMQLSLIHISEPTRL